MKGKTALGRRASVTSGATPSSVGWTGHPYIKSLPRFCRKCPIQLTLLTLTLWMTASVKRYFPLRSEEQLSPTWTPSKRTTLAVCCSMQETLSDMTDRAPKGVHLAFVGYSYTATRWPERPALVFTHINSPGLFICVFPSLYWTLARQVQSTAVRTSWCRLMTQDKETGRVFTPQWNWLVFIIQTRYNCSVLGLLSLSHPCFAFRANNCGILQTLYQKTRLHCWSPLPLRTKVLLDLLTSPLRGMRRCPNNYHNWTKTCRGINNRQSAWHHFSKEFKTTRFSPPAGYRKQKGDVMSWRKKWSD